MKSITQDARYRESLLKYVEKHGVVRASHKYNEHFSYIYFWRKRWFDDGKTLKSLEFESKKPYRAPNEHTEEEITLIKNLRRRNPDIGLMDLWYKLCDRSYTRSVSGLAKILKKLNMPTQPKTSPSPSYRQPKPYEQMNFPGERIQIDVKYVPTGCIDPETLVKTPYLKLFQYTAIDEYSRLRILEGYDEHNTYSSSLFLKQALSFYKAHGIEVKCVQVDNGTEFTKRLLANDDANISLFELTAKRLNVKIKHIKPHTPRHNGKVERSHREDQKLLYAPIINWDKADYRRTAPRQYFKELEDFRIRLKRHQNKTNNRRMKPLGGKSPLDYLENLG